MPCWDPCSNERIAFENGSANCPRARQNPARRRPRPSKIEHRGAYESPDATKSTQEAPKRRPRDIAEASKKVQKLPKSVQVAPKTGPRGPQTPPKTSLGTTKTSLGHDIGAQFQSEGSYSDFLLFLEANAKTIEFALVGGRTQFLRGFSACQKKLTQTSFGFQTSQLQIHAATAAAGVVVTVAVVHGWRCCCCSCYCFTAVAP